MMSQRTRLCCFAMTVFSIICGVGCAGDTNQKASTIASTAGTPTVEVMTDTATLTITTMPKVEVTSSPPPLSLPINRQIPPSEIQSQVRWFDTGFGGGIWSGCPFAKKGEGVKIQIVSTTRPGGYLIYEGEPIAVCVWDLPSRSGKLNWSLKTAAGNVIDNGRNEPSVDLDGAHYSEIVPDFDYTRGTYKIHVVLGNETIETEFQILPANLPIVWTVGAATP